MKTINIKNLLSVLLIVLFGAFVSACGESEPLYIAVTNVSLNKTEVELIEGESVQLTATVQPAEATNKNVTWQSNNTAVATVDDNGNVTAVKAGTAEITATANEGKTALCKITVKAKIIPVTGISLNKTKVDLVEGESIQLAATVIPENATNKTVVWKSSDTNIATVDQKGKVEALKPGNVSVTVVTEDGSIMAACEIIIKLKLPLAYVAEYNLASDGKTFLKTHAYMGGEQAYFNWNDAKAKASALGDYHLPSLNEWRAIIGEFKTDGSHINFKDPSRFINVVEIVEIKGDTRTYTADYKSMGNRICYAIKMKGAGETYRVAYRYQLKGTEGGSDFCMIVQSIYLGKSGKNKTIDDIAQESFWKTPEVERVFPAAGVVVNGPIEYLGEYGPYWSATPDQRGFVWHMGFEGGLAYVHPGFLPMHKACVRLFSNK